tara:strand:- start:59 stop:244 length:186 start_codon:yes stop_codon:yes gene_type:complete
MKVKDAIKQLQNMYKDQEEEIVIAWWDREMFADDEDFTTAMDNEDNVDWADVYDQLLLRDN